MGLKSLVYLNYVLKDIVLGEGIKIFLTLVYAQHRKL